MNKPDWENLLNIRNILWLFKYGWEKYECDEIKDYDKEKEK